MGRKELTPALARRASGTESLEVSCSNKKRSTLLKSDVSVGWLRHPQLEEEGHTNTQWLTYYSASGRKVENEMKPVRGAV